MIDCIGIEHVKELIHVLNHKVCYFLLLKDLREGFHQSFDFRVWSKVLRVVGKRIRSVSQLEKQESDKFKGQDI